jgi:pyruvate formate lyase activating enzyme
MNTAFNAKGLITNIQRFSINDGPGIRTAVFIKGCPLRCQWCHNPETQKFLPELLYDSKLCIGCGKCNEVCPACHSVENGFHSFSRWECNNCGKCAEICPSTALSVCGKQMSIDEIIKVVIADRIFYKQNGGMTISGGEPFSQGEFAIELLREAKMNGIHCAAETCGAVAPDILLRAAKFTDLFLYDIKETSRDRHKALTGRGNTLILKNLAILSEAGANIIMRAPIIPGANDRAEHFEALGKLAEKIVGVRSVDVMTYHRAGNGKYKELGREAKEYTVPDKAASDGFVAAIQKHTSKQVKLG